MLETVRRRARAALAPDFDDIDLNLTAEDVLEDLAEGVGRLAPTDSAADASDEEPAGTA